MTDIGSIQIGIDITLLTVCGRGIGCTSGTVGSGDVPVAFLALVEGVFEVSGTTGGRPCISVIIVICRISISN